MQTRFLRRASLFLLFLPTLLSAQPLKNDATYRTGKLKNGLTYFVRHNAKEPGVADFYIAQRVGSILEEPHRRNGVQHLASATKTLVRSRLGAAHPTRLEPLLAAAR